MSVVRRLLPDYEPKPEDALRDMTIKIPIRTTIEAEAQKLGLGLEDEPQTDRYSLDERLVTYLQGAARKIYLVQIPDWIADDGNYAGRVDETRFGFVGSVVRFCAEGLDAPSGGLERLFGDWLEGKEIDAYFVPWRRFDELKKGFELSSQLKLEKEWLSPNGDAAQPEGPGDEAAPPAAENEMRHDKGVLELFLASSSELEEDRQKVQLWVGRENKKLHDKGLFLKLHVWEDFLDAMSKTRLQDEYNKAVKRSDIVLCLFATRAGQFTVEEFDAALKSMHETGKPKYIYTYFKKVKVSGSDREALANMQRLNDFKDRLSELGHYPTNYKNTDDLLRQLGDQLDKIIELM